VHINSPLRAKASAEAWLHSLKEDMSFNKASRTQYHLTGSDDPHAPDYLKLPPLQARAHREASKGTTIRSSSLQPKESLPRVPLRTSRSRVRPNALTREFVGGGSSKVDDLMSDYGARADHPLARFSKPTALKFSGKQHVDDGELAKVTNIPYNSQECMQGRQLAARAREASQSNNRGLGAALFGVSGT